MFFMNLHRIVLRLIEEYGMNMDSGRKKGLLGLKVWN